MSFGFVFPGQGSQFVGMLRDLAGGHTSIEARFAEAGEAIGIDLWALAQNGQESELADTAVAQPALLTASFALWDIWQRVGGPRPGAMAGHSLGEYSALVCGGALAFVDAVKLVHRRGQLMREAVPRGRGAMAAILGLDDAAVAACCEQVDGVVSAANYNAPGQIVIAGETPAVERAVQRCREAGARRAVLLNVSGPFHCPLMAPAGEQFTQALAEVDMRLPDIAIPHNVDGEIAESVASLREKLLRQLTAPVRWTDCMRRLSGLGAKRLVECGPGKVLSGLAKRIDRSWDTHAIGTPEGLAAALEAAV